MGFLTHGRALALTMVSLLAVSGSPAAAAPVPFPGGQLDSTLLPQGEIYLEEPKPAVAPKGCEVAEKYVQLQNAGHYDKVADLFTPDALFLHAKGEPAVGREAINRFYTAQIQNLDVKIVPVFYAVAPGVCLVQLVIGRPVDGKRRFVSAAIDQFFVAPDGRARMMMPYGRRTTAMQGTIDEMNQKKDK